MDFHYWKVNYKTKGCAHSQCLTITLPRIKEVEIANSMDDLMTSKSTEGNNFSNYEILDAKIAHALKKNISSVHFRRRVSVEEQRAQKHDRSLRGRQVAYMVYEYFRATGADEAVQCLSDPFSIRIHDDDVQDFDTRVKLH